MEEISSWKTYRFMKIIKAKPEVKQTGIKVQPKNNICQNYTTKT